MKQQTDLLTPIREATENAETDRLRQQTARRATQRRTPSTQDLLSDLLDIREGMIILPNGERRRVLQLFPLNFDRRTTGEQFALAGLFHDLVFLPLTYRLQFLRISRHTQVDEITDNIIARAAASGDIYFHEMGEAIANTLRDEAARHSILDVSYYLVIPYSAGEEEGENGTFEMSPLRMVTGEIWQNARRFGAYFGFGAGGANHHRLQDRKYSYLDRALDQRMYALQDALQAAGIASRSLDTLETLKLCALIINSERERLDGLTVDDLAELSSVASSRDRRRGQNEGDGQNYHDSRDIENKVTSFKVNDPHPKKPSSANDYTGLRTAIDLIAPDRVEIDDDHLMIDGRYHQTLVVRKLPRVIAANALRVLDQANTPSVTSLIVEPVPRDLMCRLLDRQASGYLSSLHSDARHGTLRDEARAQALGDNQALRQNLEKKLEMGTNISLYIKVEGASVRELAERSRHYISILTTAGFKVRPAHLRQDLGLRAVLPFVQDALHNSRLTDGTTATYLALSNRESLCHRDGIFFGKALGGSGGIVMIDPASPELPNGHMGIFGTSGTGKSYTLKWLLAQARILDHGRVFVLDPDQECFTLCQEMQGEYVIVSPQSRSHINLLDFVSFDRARQEWNNDRQEDEEDRDPLAWHINNLETGEALPRLVADGPLNAAQFALLDAALYETYSRAGIGHALTSHQRPAPLLGDLQRTLLRFADPAYAKTASTPEEATKRRSWSETAALMAARLEPYVNGTFANLFNRPTNIDFSNRFIVFGVRDVKPEQAPIVYWMIANCVWNRARILGERSYFAIDEMKHIMATGGGSKLVLDIAQRGRKRNCALILCTQYIADCLTSEEGVTIFSNLSTRLYLGQTDVGAQAVRRIADITEEEHDFLLRAVHNPGTGILEVARNRTSLQILVAPRFDSVFNTDPRRTTIIKTNKAAQLSQREK